MKTSAPPSRSATASSSISTRSLSSCPSLTRIPEQIRSANPHASSSSQIPCPKASTARNTSGSPRFWASRPRQPTVTSRNGSKKGNWRKLNTGSIGRGGNERGVGDMGPAYNTRPILFGYLNICLYICQNLTNMLFAETIKHLREIQSLTQKQLALELGIDVPMY